MNEDDAQFRGADVGLLLDVARCLLSVEQAAELAVEIAPATSPAEALEIGFVSRQAAIDALVAVVGETGVRDAERIQAAVVAAVEEALRELAEGDDDR
jgi:hypothetical protein